MNHHGSNLNCPWLPGAPTARGLGRAVRFAGALYLLAVLAQGSAIAQDGPPALEVSPDNLQLVDQQPFDRIYLNERNEFATMDIYPPEIIPPKPIPDEGFLIFEWLEDDEFLLQVPYGELVDYKTFNELLLEEANLLLRQKNYARAFRNILYVYDRGGRNNPALEKSLQQILVLDGSKNFAEGNYSLALSIFEDVHEREPGKRIEQVKVIDMVMRCYDQMVQVRFDQGDFAGVRLVLSSVYERYGNDVQPLLDRWQQKLAEKNREYVQAARSAIAAGQAEAAHMAARQALFAVPESVESKRTLNEVISAFPIVHVGVSQTALNGGDPTRIDNWGARRLGRLTQRTMVEFDGLTDEGGDYAFLNGELKQVDEDGIAWEFEISQEPQFGVPAISAFQISQRLLDRADDTSPIWYEPWEKVVSDVRITSPTTVRFNLRIPFIRPEALLQVPYELPRNHQPIQNGPYRVTSQPGQVTQLEPNPDFGELVPRGLPVIKEVLFDNPSDAVDSLLRGDIDAVDRVPIQDVRKLARDPQVQVARYLVPTIHMLIPNVRNDYEPWKAESAFAIGDIVKTLKPPMVLVCVKPGTSGEDAPKGPGADGSAVWAIHNGTFLQNSQFRSGLMSAIDRQRLIEDVIGGGNQVSGCEVISGPFPVGTQDNDQIAYAYNNRIQSPRSDTQLGMLMSQVVRHSLLAKLREAGVENPELELPMLVLAHPTGELPRSACRAIELMWKSAGVQVELRELPPGETVPPDNDFDFLYVELAMSEPLTDVQLLLGSNGIASQMNPSIQQLVRDLSYATSWRTAGRKLRDLHRQTYNDVSILPLYQIQEYLAYRKNVTGVGRNVVGLYDNVADWRINPWKIETADDE